MAVIETKKVAFETLNLEEVMKRLRPVLIRKFGATPTRFGMCIRGQYPYKDNLEFLDPAMVISPRTIVATAFAEFPDNTRVKLPYTLEGLTALVRQAAIDATQVQPVFETSRPGQGKYITFKRFELI